MTPLRTLRQLGTGEEPSLAVKRRVLQRVQGSVALAAALDTKAPAPSPPAATSVASGGVSAGSGAKAVVAIAVWLSGAATGIWLYRASGQPTATVATVVAVVPASSQSSAASATTPVPAAPSVAAPAELPKPPARGDRRPTPPLSTLEKERRLLDRARAALGSDGEAALEALALHERQFPRGALREERLAMRVRALESLGRHAEARTRALEFREEFPSSFLMPALESVLAEP